jgi:hypothetical protein
LLASVTRSSFGDERGVSRSLRIGLGGGVIAISCSPEVGACGSIQEARERIAHLERSAEDVARLREEALNEKAARELFAMQETSAERRKDAVVDKVMTLLPVVAARFAGTNALQATGSSRTDLLLSTLSRSVKPQQWVQMARRLSDEQKIVFVELLDSMLKTEEEPGESMPKAEPQ